MNQYAIVSESGEVINVVLWDGEAEWDSRAALLIPSHVPVGIGWSVVESEFVDLRPGPELPPEEG
jgi:hypothetical protein